MIWSSTINRRWDSQDALVFSLSFGLFNPVEDLTLLNIWGRNVKATRQRAVWVS